MFRFARTPFVLSQVLSQGSLGGELRALEIGQGDPTVTPAVTICLDLKPSMVTAVTAEFNTT